MTLETYNSLCNATKTPSALMKVHAHINLRSRKLEATHETKYLTAVYDAFFADDRVNDSSKVFFVRRVPAKILLLNAFADLR